MYSIRILGQAARELEKLDKTTARRIVERIRWLAANIGNTRLEGLTGDLAGLYKLRVGDYRIIYEIIHSQDLLVIHAIGHRRDIYRRRR